MAAKPELDPKYFAEWDKASEKMSLMDRARTEEMKRAMMDIAHMTASPTIIAGPAKLSDPAHVDALSKRVQELEGYMPILLDALEKQDERIEALAKTLHDLTDRVDERHLG